MKSEKNIRKIKVLLCWDSGSGNTRWAAEKLHHYLEEFGFESKLFHIRSKLDFELTDFDLIGFCYPVYAFKPIISMLEFADKIPPGGGRPCFLFHTNGGEPLGSSRYFAKKLFFKGYSVLCDCSVKMQDSWTILRSLKFITKYPENINALADQKIYEFAAKLKEVFTQFIHGNYTLPKFKKSYSPLNLMRYVFTRKLIGLTMPIIVDLVLCVKCGKCVEHCPTGRMKLEHFPKPKGDCIGCYGCINLCPTNAIESFLTSGKLQYKGPISPGENSKGNHAE